MSKVVIDDAVYRLHNKMPFLGHMVQSMSTIVSKEVPTAGVMYDTKSRRYVMYVNPDFFGSLTLPERVSTVEHEMYHILYRHTSYVHPDNGKEKLRLNIAMDLVINQRIDNLPEGAMLIKNFKDNKGNLFPADAPTEKYYALLEDDAKAKVPQKGNEDGQGEGQAGGPGQPGEKGQGGMKEITVGEMLAQADDSRGMFDTHGWEDGDVSEAEHLQATKDLLKRTMDKSSNEYSQTPDFVREALEEIDAKLKKLNCKKLLEDILVKSMPNSNRAKTWHKPNKHYGTFAKGSRPGKFPSVYFLLDTSGSISIKEANEFLAVTNQFMTAGANNCTVGLFHTDLYKTYDKVKKRFKLDHSDIQSGGTCLTSSLKKVIKDSPDLVVILTDGYFSRPDVNYRKLPNVITIIAKQGDMNHPLAKLGKTIGYTFEGE